MKRKLLILCLWSMTAAPLLLLLSEIRSLTSPAEVSEESSGNSLPLPQAADEAQTPPAMPRQRIRSSSVMPYFSFSGRVLPQG